VTSVPVLVLAWRRPDLTERVLEAVAAYRPARLFLACDGWGDDAPDELVEAVRATRAVLDREPGWPCTVERRYADRNLGLRTAVSGALDWFLASCGEGAILEDDCLPHADFLPYCEELLARYRDDPRVMCISGDNSSGTPVSDGSSYAFIRWPLIWGWATWQRAWMQYDHDLARVAVLDDSAWAAVVPDADERRVWRERLATMRGPGALDTWDFVWTLSVLAAGGRCVLPASNLVTNLGFGVGATHTVTGPARRLHPVASILPIRHPDEVHLDETASRRVFDVALDGAGERRRFAWERTLRGRLRRAAHRTVGRAVPRVLRRRRPGTPAPWLR
jgi:hypothetical protein